MINDSVCDAGRTVADCIGLRAGDQKGQRWFVGIIVMIVIAGASVIGSEVIVNTRQEAELRHHEVDLLHIDAKLDKILDSVRPGGTP